MGHRGGAAGSLSPAAPRVSSATIGLRRTPRPPSISTSTTSPGFIHKGGLRAKPTPSGVPVEITSPAASGVQSEQYEIKVGMSKIRSSMPVCWTSLPLSRVARWRRVGSGNLVGGDDPRAKAAGRVEVLPGSNRVLELDVPDRAVVEAGITEDVAQRIRFGDISAGLADDEGQLALIIEIARDPRTYHRLVMRDESVDKPQEDLRVLRRRPTRFGRVGAIIAAGADDLVGVGDRR